MSKIVETTTKSENPVDEIERPRRAERLKARLAVLLLCAGLSAIAVVPFFFMGRLEDGKSAPGLHMPTTHDMFLHYDQMKSFYEGLSAGEVYPRWEEDTNRGFGAPTTSYYPPGVYYLTSAFYLMSKDWIKALMWSQLLMMLASAGAIYLYARRVMSRAGAMVAMSAYVMGPYHLIDQYQRGAIAELMGFVFMPLIMWGVEEMMCGKRDRDARNADGGAEGGGEGRWGRVSREMKAVSVLGASYGGFVWSHPPTAYQFSLGIGIYVLMKGVMSREWRGMVKVGLGIMLGVGLSAAYIIPAALEQNLVNSENIAQTYPYHDSYALVRLGVYSGAPDFFLSLIDRIWILTALFIIIAAIALLAFNTRALRRAPRLKQHVILWLILGCFMCFMMTSLSYPLGRLIPKIEIGVFTWRMLSITTLVVALMAGACAHVAFQVGKRRRHEAALAASVALWVVIGSAWFSIEEVVKPYSNGDAFVPEPEHLNYALMPHDAYGDLTHLPKVEPAALAQGKGIVTVERWSPELRIVRVELSEPDRLLVRTFKFPGWVVTVDDRPANVIAGRGLRVQDEKGEEAVIRNLDYAGWTPSLDGKPMKVLGEISLGDIVIEMEPGVHEVRLRYQPTAVGRKSSIVTLSSFGLLGVLILMPLALKRRTSRS